MKMEIREIDYGQVQRSGIKKARQFALKKDQVMIMEKKDEEVRHEQMNKGVSND